MNRDLILHILRNPWGKDPEQIRRARLEACDLIEIQSQMLGIMTNALEAIASEPEQVLAKMNEAHADMQALVDGLGVKRQLND